MIFNMSTPPGSGGSSSDIADGAVTVSKLNSNVTTFTEASTRTNIASGDSITTIWGKIKKWFTDLKAIAFSGSYTDVTGLTDSTGQLDVDSITADSAEISGWDISGQRFFHEGTADYNGSNVPTKVYIGGGVNTNHDVIVVNITDKGESLYPFYVRGNGELHATDITTSGLTSTNITTSGLTSSGTIKTTQTGNDSFVAQTSGTGGLMFRAENSLRNGALHISSAGNFGLWDLTNSNWVLQSATNGNISIPHPISTSGTITKTTGGDIVSGSISTAAGLQYRIKNSARNCSLHLNNAGLFGLWDDTNSNWVLQSATNGNVSVPHALSSSSFSTTGAITATGVVTGGSFTTTGSITSGSTATNGTGAVYVKSPTRTIALHSNAAGNAGLYDTTNNGWILRSDTSQGVYIPHNTYVSGDYLYLGTTAATNSPNIICANNKNNVALSCTRSSAGVYHHNGSGSSAKWLISISTAGVVTANTSDIRYKNIYGNISEYETLTMLRGLDVINFTYKEDENNVIQNGFIAQQMRDLLKSSGIGYRPYLDIQDMTCEEPLTLYDLDAPEGNVVYGVDYSRFTPLLVSGWQIHDAEIKNLKAEIAQLKTKINNLK